MREFLIECHGERHRVRVVRGAVAFLNHPVWELEAEISLSALAGEEPAGCAYLLSLLRDIKSLPVHLNLPEDVRTWLYRGPWSVRRSRQEASYVQWRRERAAELEMRWRIATRLMRKVADELGIAIDVEVGPDGLELAPPFLDGSAFLEGYTRARGRVALPGGGEGLLVSLSSDEGRAVVLEPGSCASYSVRWIGEKRLQALKLNWRRSDGTD